MEGSRRGDGAVCLVQSWNFLLKVRVPPIGDFMREIAPICSQTYLVAQILKNPFRSVSWEGK